MNISLSPSLNAPQHKPQTKARETFSKKFPIAVMHSFQGEGVLVIPFFAKFLTPYFQNKKGLPKTGETSSKLN